jgi:hypothetical protein
VSFTPYLRSGCAVPRTPPAGTSPTVCSPAPGRTAGASSGSRAAVRRLLGAAGRVDDRAAARLITDALETDGALATWQLLCAPALAAVGGPAGTPATAPALALVTGVRAALDGRLTRLARPGRRPTVMLAAADSSRSPGLPGDLPLAALAVVLLENGVESWRFGAGLPWEALSTAVSRAVPDQLVVWSSVPSPDRTARRAVLEAAHPAIPVVPAGPGWPEAMTLPTVASVCLTLAR